MAHVRRLLDRQRQAPRSDGRRVVYRAGKDGPSEDPVAPGRKLVFVGSQHCGFSRAALDAIAGDETVAALMAAHGLVLTGPKEDVGTARHRDWAREHPALAFRSVALKGRWPEIPFGETPVAYLVDGGEGREVLRGWPREGARANLAALRRALQELDARDAP